jgi:hypothetical protein
MNGKPGIVTPRFQRNNLYNCRADTLKGSYYANPVMDTPSVPPDLREAYPEYYGTNICPLSHLLYSISGRF